MKVDMAKVRHVASSGEAGEKVVVTRRFVAAMLDLVEQAQPLGEPVLDVIDERFKL